MVSARISKDKLRITFEMAMKNVGTGADGFTLNASGGAATLTYASGEGTATLTYTVSRTVARDETVTLDYTAGSVTDVDDNWLESFSGVNVLIVAGSGLIRKFAFIFH